MGPANDRSNQARAAGEKAARAGGDGTRSGYLPAAPGPGRRRPASIVWRVAEPNAFSDVRLDRAAHRRTDAAWLQGALGGTRAQAIVATADTVALAPDGAALRMPLADLAGLARRQASCSASKG